jgi:hypothetical protein
MLTQVSNLFSRTPRAKALLEGDQTPSQTWARARQSAISEGVKIAPRSAESRRDIVQEPAPMRLHFDDRCRQRPTNCRENNPFLRPHRLDPPHDHIGRQSGANARLTHFEIYR